MDNLQHVEQERQGIFATWHIYVLGFVGACTLFSRFFQENLYGFFQDDFFYYAEVARNLARHHISSFDGIHLTNGYHPLWLLTLALLFKLFSGRAVFVAVQALSLLALFFCYAGLLRCLRALATHEALVPLTSLVLSLYILLFLRFGMEITLTLPISIWMLAIALGGVVDAPWWRSAAFGVLACFCVLSRIDSILLVSLLIVAILLESKAPRRMKVRLLVILAICFLPFAAYLAINQHYFHTLLPVSGEAKQLKPLLPPSSSTITSLLLPFDRTKLAVVYPALAVIACGLFVFALSWKTIRRRWIFLALFAFPAVHFSLLSLLSDWTLWPWYFYSLTYPLLASTVILLSAPVSSTRDAMLANSLGERSARAVLGCAAALYIAFAMLYAVFKHPEKQALLAIFVANFTATHPGIYAMGDDAGSTAFRSSQPIIQMEGLMMDRHYIQLIRNQTPLPDVLRQYGADFYVTLNPPAGHGCMNLTEPVQAGPHSPHMEGKVCVAPLATDEQGGVYVSIYRASDIEPR